MAAMITVPMKRMSALPQDTATTCWYTCLVMMFQWADRDPGEIKPKLIAAGIDWDDACRTGLKTNKYLTAAKALGLHARGAGQSWSTYEFKSWVATSPVWCAGRWHSEGSHNVVVIGASDEEIRFIDPWWEGSKEATISTRFANDFIHGDGKAAPGTDYYIGWVGAVMLW